MKFRKTFEIESGKVDRILAFFTTQGYRLEERSSNSYKFKRGSGWSTLYTFDVRKCPTTVDVSLIEGEENKLQILVNYNVSGKHMQIFTAGDREEIMAEIENLEAFTKLK